VGQASQSISPAWFDIKHWLVAVYTIDLTFNCVDGTVWVPRRGHKQACECQLRTAHDADNSVMACGERGRTRFCRTNSIGFVFAYWREVNLPFCKVHQYLQESETFSVNEFFTVLPVGTGGSLLAVETVA
jgi:hypothetical protein